MLVTPSVVDILGRQVNALQGRIGWWSFATAKALAARRPVGKIRLALSRQASRQGQVEYKVITEAYTLVHKTLF